MTLNIHSIDDGPDDTEVVDRVRKTLVRLRRHTQFLTTHLTDLYVGTEIGLNNCLIIGASSSDLLRLSDLCSDSLSGGSFHDSAQKIKLAHKACWDLFHRLTLRDEVIEE